MGSSVAIGVAMGGILAVASSAGAEPARSIRGVYRNPALGFAVVVPHGLTGTAGDDAGPERGVGIHLPSGGRIVVFGEPNSLEWPSAADGIRWILAQHPECAGGEVAPARIGTLDGAGGRESCGTTVTLYRLAFRPKGGPIYWLVLETDAVHEQADRAVLEQVAATVRLIRWE